MMIMMFIADGLVWLKVKAMARIHEKRWENAKQIAEKINNYLDAGFLVFDEDFKPVKYKFIISDDEVLQPHQSPNTTGTRMFTLIFSNDLEFDDGVHTSIKDFNKRFEDWKVVDPKDLISI